MIVRTEAETRAAISSATCAKCAFYHPEVTTTNLLTTGHGECRAHAPALAIEYESHTGVRLWPSVYENDWCAEFLTDAEG